VARSLDECGVQAPVSEAVKMVVDEMVQQGHGDADYSAVARVLFQKAGLDS
jgi:3-hydroxyisobutyrate dehydrogenase-like beta-hydroxyacid dehydrogenase